ncbi:hypothetical protein MtrunA17_Chr4g0069021 [Medicago truncatula]|uniref:Uncharacterized protein n=1 Tax=Medicago truncatula TaxID=3880 RepID=A0A396IFR8_MEDTR|nr:hypothetical protein MtrunA17_Chr4g0069021 [Medicago truncatula]
MVSGKVCQNYAGCPDSDFQCCSICSNSGHHGKCEGNKCCCDAFTPMQDSNM